MKYKKILSCVLAAAMAVSTVPVVAVGADEPNTTATPEPIIITNTDPSNNGLTIECDVPFQRATAENFTFTPPEKLTYNGTDKTATVETKQDVQDKMGELTVHYYSDAEYKNEVTETQNAGTYYVGITLTEGYSYAEETEPIHGDSWKFTIEKNTSPSVPNAPTATEANVTKNSITLDTVSDCEYKIGEGDNWQDSPVFENLLPDTEYTFYQRIKESNNISGTNASNAAKIKTLEDKYGLAITMNIGERKTANDKAIIGKDGKVNIAELIGTGTADELVINDADQIIAKNGDNYNISLENGILSYTFVSNNNKANKSAEVRIPVTGNGDPYAIVVTLTAVTAPTVDTSDNTKVTWDAPGDGSNSVVLDGEAAPDIKDDGSVEMSKGTVTIGETSSPSASITVNEGGKAILKPDADKFGTVELSGEGSTVKIGTAGGSQITLAAGEKAFISDDGKYAVVEDNENNSSFYSSQSDAKVEMKSEIAANNDVKAVEVDNNATISESDINNLISNASSGTRNIISVDAIGADGKKKDSVNFGTNKVTVRVPIPSPISAAVLRYVNKQDKVLELVKSKIEEITGTAKSYLRFDTIHFSDWVYGQATGLQITKVDSENGSYNIAKVNDSSPSDPLRLNSGDKITLSVMPNDGYRLSKLTYTGADTKEVVTISAKESDYEFTMPGENVTINAVFAKISSGGTSYTAVEKDGITYHIEADNAEVYEAASSITNADIADKIEGQNVTVIGENAFNSCTALKSVTIPETVEEIASNAFWGCTALTEITIPESVTKIDKNAFSHCSALTTINGVKGSAAEAFANANGYTFKDINAVEPPTDNKPSAPTNVAISKDGTVTWDKVDNEVQYKVFKKYGGTAYHSGWVTDNSYKFKNLPNQDYEIYVAAKNEYGTSWSEHLQVKVENPLGTVRKVNVSNGTVSWNAVQGAVAYKVGKVVGGKTYYTGKVTETTAEITPATKDYQVFVVAFDKDGKTSWGKKNLVEVGNLGTVLDPKVDAKGNVTWTAARNAVKYKVGKTVNGKTYYTGELTTNSATIKVPKSDYKVFVVAFDKDGNRTWGTKVDVKVK